MRTILLVAMNFVRDQRWPILVLMMWVLVLSVLPLYLDLRIHREELLFVFKQSALYAFPFAIFFGGSAIHNERKSRRILSVLSKGVDRRQYLSGLLCGVAISLVVYCFCMGLTGSWVLGLGGFPLALLWFLMLAILAACFLASSVSVLFSTFLPPLFSYVATSLVLGVPALAGFLFGDTWWSHVVPVYQLVYIFLQASFDTPWRANWAALGLAVGETVLCWLIASGVFAMRDVAVAVD